MKRIPITPTISDFPSIFYSYLRNAELYDSSSSPEAKVFFIDKDQGYYLKSAAKGALETEANLTRFFHKKHLATEVIEYISEERDWLLTEKVPGEDCTFAPYLEDPKRLCDTLAALLRNLHDTDYAGCPIPNRTKDYLAAAKSNFQKGIYDTSLFPDNWGYSSAEEAWLILQNNQHLLKNDTLLHGDYCLPNIILNNWTFSGFIDLGNGGVGDKHIDLFWGAWTLNFNLKTDRYCSRFLDAYGRADIDMDMLKIIAAAEVFG